MNRARFPINRMMIALGVLAVVALLVLAFMYLIWLPAFLGHPVGP